MPMQTHPARVNQHRHSLGGATSATGVLQFDSRLGEAIGRGLFDRCPINARLDQPTLSLRRPLITPVLEQPLKADALHKIRACGHRSERHLKESEALKEAAALAVRSLAIKIEGTLAADGVLDVQPELLGSDAKVFNDRRNASFGRHFADARSPQSVPGQAQHDFTLGIHRAFHETTPDAIEQVLTRWTGMTAHRSQAAGLLQSGDLV